MKDKIKMIHYFSKNQSLIIITNFYFLFSELTLKIIETLRIYYPIRVSDVS